MTGSEGAPARLCYQPAWMLLGLLLIAAVVAASLLSVTGPLGAPGIDKIYHVLAYGALMGWWGMVQPTRRGAWAMGLLILGLLLEGLQSLTGYRTLDRWDAAANTIGVLLALALLKTPLQRLLPWFDGQLADRLDSRPP